VLLKFTGAGFVSCEGALEVILDVWWSSWVEVSVKHALRRS